jgi:hypothetical protein
LNLEPGVIELPGGERVGMCPAGIKKATLESLLNGGIFHFGAGPPREHPLSIFNIYQGVPYRAVRTLEGISYHGFPCVSARRDVPPVVMKKLMARAVELDCKASVAKWFKQNP